VLLWPVAIAWTVLAAGIVICIAYVAFARRSRPTTDAMASDVDTDAALNGELRSAHWFAQTESSDPWEQFHLDAAAERARAVEWKRVYPAPAFNDYRIALASFVAAALVIGFGSRIESPAQLQARVLKEAADNPAAAEMMVPDDLQKRLEMLFDKIQKGELSPEAARAEIADLKDIAAKMSADMEAAMAKLAKQGGEAGKGDKGAGMDPKSLAAQAEEAAKSNKDMPEDVKWSLKDLAARLSNQDRPPTTGSAASPGASGDTEKQQNSGDPKSGASDQGNMSVQMMRVADPGSSEMLSAGMGSMGGDSRQGGPGRQGGRGRGNALAGLESVLKKETIEADKDSTGANVLAEQRRKTEESHSTLGFAHVAVPTTFDRSRAVAPPPVPEERRALLLQYFIRRQ